MKSTYSRFSLRPSSFYNQPHFLPNNSGKPSSVTLCPLPAIHVPLLLSPHFIIHFFRTFCATLISRQTRTAKPPWLAAIHVLETKFPYCSCRPYIRGLDHGGGVYIFTPTFFAIGDDVYNYTPTLSGIEKNKIISSDKYTPDFLHKL